MSHPPHCLLNRIQHLCRSWCGYLHHQRQLQHLPWLPIRSGEYHRWREHRNRNLRSPSTTLTLTTTVSPGAKLGMVLPRRAISSCSSCWMISICYSLTSDSRLNSSSSFCSSPLKPRVSIISGRRSQVLPSPCFRRQRLIWAWLPDINTGGTR